MQPSTTPKRAVVIAADLMFESRIAAHADASRWRLDFADTPAHAEGALAQPAELVLVDLQMPDIDIGRIVAAAGDAPVVAYGRHTDAAALRAARQAGCAKALARSEFVEELPALFGHAAAGSGSGR